MSQINEAQQLFFQALAKQQAGALADAEQFYRKALALVPDRPSILTNLVVVLIGQDKYTEAHAFALRLVGVEPGSSAARTSLGVCALKIGDFDQALAEFDRVLAIDQNHEEAWVNRGLALAAAGRFQEALAAFDAGLAIRPNWPQALLNKAIALRELKRPADALSCLDVLLSENPDFAEAMDVKGSVLRDEKMFEEAVALHSQALRLRPGFVDALVNRGNSLRDLGRRKEALADYDAARALKSDDGGLLVARAIILSEMGRREEAISDFNAAIALGGDREEIEFHLAGLGAAEAPATSPRNYVTELFDDYADQFELHLTQDLKYQAPQLLIDALGPLIANRNCDVADLGCGTGLMAPLLKPYTRRLDGVDLSPRMLERARQRGSYNLLHVGDMVEFLLARPRSYDVVVAVDVFVYVGKLDSAFAATRQALRPGGLLAFTVEMQNEGTFALRETKRYAHSPDYIDRLATTHGFSLRHMKRRVLRMNQGEEVTGLVVVLAAASPQA